jgi:hypothetical protein
MRSSLAHWRDLRVALKASYTIHPFFLKGGYLLPLDKKNDGTQEYSTHHHDILNIKEKKHLWHIGSVLKHSLLLIFISLSVGVFTNNPLKLLDAFNPTEAWSLCKYNTIILAFHEHSLPKKP